MPDPAQVLAALDTIDHFVDLAIDETALKHKPFILAHGVQDTMLPIEWARLNRDRLQGLGVDLEDHEFLMGHHVSMGSLETIYTWLEQHL